VVAPALLRVYPTPEALRRLVRAQETSLVTGSQVARAKGAGVEFADMRPYAPGDRVREVNWRATARRGALWVNQRHPERSTEVVVFVDAFVGADLPRVVPAADALVRSYLGERDRVGIVSFGGTIRWIRTGMGLRQQYLLVDALLATSAFASVVWRDLDVLPPRVLPPKALVVAVSSLQDERAVAALWDLRNRGADLAVLEVEPSFVDGDRRVGAWPSRRAVATDERALARRLWALRRDILRDRLRTAGVPVSRWTLDRPLAEAIEELGTWPRRRRVAG
jgi:uncharacterized protein (DUF58 family)